MHGADLMQGDGDADGNGADDADGADGADDGPQDILRKLHPSMCMERYSSVLAPYPLCYINKPQDAGRFAGMNWMESKMTQNMINFVENPMAQENLLWRVSRPMLITDNLRAIRGDN